MRSGGRSALTIRKQDLSFVRYVFQKDANEDYPDLLPSMIDAFGYGRLDFIIALTLPASKRFKTLEPTLHTLAQTTESQGAEGNAATKFSTKTPRVRKRSVAPYGDADSRRASGVPNGH